MAAAETLTITHGIDDNIKDVSQKVQSVDAKVAGVDHKIGSVIQGESKPHCWPPNLSSTSFLVRCEGYRKSHPRSGQSSQPPTAFVVF